MTCERYDRGLALYVEGDLPRKEAARLERHLQRCPRCQGFLKGLRDSQRGLEALAAEPIEAGALVEVRERVLAVLGGLTESGRRVPTRRNHPPRRAWGLALAAGLGLVAFGLAFVLRTRPTAPRQTTGLVAASPTAHLGPAPAHPPVQPPAVTAVRRSPEEASAPPSERRSTVRPAPSVSQGMEPDPVRPPPTLSPEDADQLARAVVAVSRIRRLSDRPASVPVSVASPAALVRLETPDPSVVIYWQLESNGG
jgi:Putative zinc-finger